MGNLRQKYTTEEWDEMVDSTKPGFVEKRIEQSIQEAAELNSKKAKSTDGIGGRYLGFIDGAKWMMENIQINLRRVK
jgi:hypothetical protein